MRHGDERWNITKNGASRQWSRSPCSVSIALSAIFCPNPPPNPSRYTVSMQDTKLVFELRGAVQYDLDSGQRDRLKKANTVDVSSQEHARRGALRVTCRPR
jgi:hypothetical protein